MKDIIIRGRIFKVVHEMILLISRISLNKLIDGGAAMLQIHSRNHHNAIDGIICISPLHNNMFRDDTRSNTMLVKQNMPDEHSPWAIINAKHPVTPVFVPTITPAITRLMCATEE